MKFNELYEKLITEKVQSKEHYVEVDKSKIKVSIKDEELGLKYSLLTSEDVEDGESKDFKINKNGWTFSFTLSTDYYTMLQTPVWNATKGKMLVGMFDEVQVVRATSKEDYATFLSDLKLKSIDDILETYSWGDV